MYNSVPFLLHPGINNPIVNREKIFYSLYLKLGIIKKFVKVLHNEGARFRHIFSVSPDLIFKKIKLVLFDRPHILPFVCDKDFVRKMSSNEKSAWLSFKAIIQSSSEVLIVTMMLDF